jgi:tetratricopeptide (TPR) repeat protein
VEFLPERLAAVRTVPELAELLRELRGREAADRGGAELSYRDLAGAAGWSEAPLGEWFTGQDLPPTDEFDTLVRLLGATAVEQELLAAARDRVGEARPVPAPVTFRPNVPQLLPASASGLIDRSAELSELDGWLARGDGTVCVLSGPVGVGKSALAVHWGRRVAARFPDGQLYVDLHSHGRTPMSSGDALVRLLTALGHGGGDISLDEDARAEAYRAALRGQRVLLLLDDAESAEQIAPLLPDPGPTRVLVTTRNPIAASAGGTDIGVTAARTTTTGTTPAGTAAAGTTPARVTNAETTATGTTATGTTPTGTTALAVEPLPADDARRLLAALVGGRVTADPAGAAAFAERCGRLPLALHLAAAAVWTWPDLALADLAARLRATGGDPDATLVGVADWAYRQLPVDAARMFRLLGLHPGTDTDPHAAAALAALDPTTAQRLLDTLVQAHFATEARPGRYALPGPLRAYAAPLGSTVDDPEDRYAAVARLLDHYLDSAALAMDRLYPADAHNRPRPAALTETSVGIGTAEAAESWLDGERANLVATAGHAAAHGHQDHAVQLAATIARYLGLGGHHVDAVAVHTYALTAADELGDRAAEAYAATNLGIINDFQGRFAVSAGHQQRALTLFRKLGDQAGMARALGNLSVAEYLQGRIGPAAVHQEGALDIFRELGDRIGEARALSNLGIFDQMQGRYQIAANRQRQALTLFRRLSDPAGQAHALTNLGAVLQRQGEYERAVGQHREALMLFRRIGDRAGEATALTNLGDALRRRGEPSAAITEIERALAAFREIGDHSDEAIALNELGTAHRDAGHPEEALTCYAEALRLGTETGNRYEQARAHAGIAVAQRDTGQRTLADQHASLAHDLYRDLEVAEASAIPTARTPD